jgi:lysozyme family protein
MARVELSAPLRDEYERLFDECRITAERLGAVDSLVQRITRERPRYSAVEQALGVPWFLVGVVHCMECSLDFRRHLHNGDPLAARTIRVPAGRPVNGSPPFSWEASAIDALQLQHLDLWHDWSIAGLLYQLEGYNGWGYRLYHAPVRSPYLWSFSNHYQKGKYVGDGQWSATAVSKQCGSGVLLRRMVEQFIISLGPTPSAASEPPATLASDPLIRYWTGGPEVPGARALQEFLNRIPGIFVSVDGKPGEKTSQALRRVTGRYLVGDPRAGA